MQRARKGTISRFARRMGLTGASGALVAALAVLMVLMVAVGVGKVMTTRDGFEVVRSAPVAASGAPGEAEPSSQEAQGEEADVDGATAASDEPEEAGPVDEIVPVVVHVDGAVAAPGVYEIADATPRVTDAVEAAGGLAPDADTTAINLAAVLSDGQKVHIPVRGEEPAAAVSEAALEAHASAGPVNINTATAEELQTLPGVGEVTARAIVEERERGGPFASPEDLMRVSGIGQKKFERLREQICV